MPQRLIAHALAALAVILAVAGSDPAYAHNGVGAAFKGHVGGYIVYAYDGDPLSRTQLEYRLVVLNASTKEPVYDEHVAVTATWPGQPTAVATVTTFANVFFYDLPNPYPRHWLMHLTLTGRLGGGRVTYKMHGAAPRSASPVIVVSNSGATPWAAIIAGVAATAAIAAGLILWLRRRRRERAPDLNAREQLASESSPPDSHTPERLRGSSNR